jgi:hypothetical protein
VITPDGATIVFTVSGERPGYLAETLGSWSRARGVAGWRTVFLLEPGTRVPECHAVIGAAFPAATVLVHPERLGVLANPHAALARAFADGAMFAVLAEEDVVVADDVLEFLAHGAATYRDDPSVLALCAFSRLPAPQPADAVGDGRFSPWVWGTWDDRWHDVLGPSWFEAARAPVPGAGSGFDFGVERTLAATARRVVIPLASRSDDIGQFGGVHALPEEYEAGRAATFAAHRPPQRLREVPSGAVQAPVGVDARPGGRGAPGSAGTAPLPSSV